MLVHSYAIEKVKRKVQRYLRLYEKSYIFQRRNDNYKICIQNCAKNQNLTHSRRTVLFGIIAFC